MAFNNQSYDQSDLDSLLNQMTTDNRSKQELKNEVRNHNQDAVEGFIWKALSKLFCESVPALRGKRWLRWIVEEIAPVILSTLWHYFFDR
jgi:hypothetical protein